MLVKKVRLVHLMLPSVIVESHSFYNPKAPPLLTSRRQLFQVEVLTL